MDGQADGFRLIGQRALDRLFDPPRGVGRELATLFRIEALDGLHQADVALRDQVGDRHAVVGIVLGDFHDQAQVGPDHVRSRLRVALLDALCELHLFLGREQRRSGNLTEIEFQTAF